MQMLPDSTKPEKETPAPPSDDDKYPKDLRLYATLVPACLAVFLVALDRLITTTAQITSTFDSAGDIGWYGTVYMVATCAFQLQFGRLFGLVGAGSIKGLFLAVIGIFEVGSAVYGAAPSSAALIVGRATSPAVRWAAFQVVYGLGLGLASRVPNVAAQTVLPRPDVPLGASLMFFGQQLFGAIFVTVGQVVLDQQLGRRLAALPGSGITSARQVAEAGTTDVIGLVLAALRPAALLAFNASVRMGRRPRDGLCQRARRVGDGVADREEEDGRVEGE